MKQEVKNQIEKLIRDNADDNVVSVSLFITNYEIRINETTFKKTEGRSMQNLRGEWVK